MRYLKLSGLALAVVFTAGAAQAQTATVDGYDWTYYASGGYTYIHVSDSGLGADLGAITGRFGARYKRYFGAEAEGSVGIVNQKISGVVQGVNVTGVSLDLNSQFAGYLVGYLPVGERAELLARAGYGRAELSASYQGHTVSESGDTWNVGVGGQYRLDRYNGVRVDYTRYTATQSAGTNIDTVTASYVRRFW